jgi:hypothetical protein
MIKNGVILGELLHLRFETVDTKQAKQTRFSVFTKIVQNRPKWLEITFCLFCPFPFRSFRLFRSIRFSTKRDRIE